MMAGKNKEKNRKKKRNGSLPKSVKQLIGYDSMLRNGIAYLGDDRWSATVMFTDINYQLSPEEHQMEVIDRWAKLINSFDAGQSLQIAAYTRTRGMDEILRDITMPDHGDGLDAYRRDYNGLIAGKLETASRNTSTVKTLTVTIQEPDRETAVSTLNALCTSLTAQMRAIDECHATRLDRGQRLRLMAEILRPGEPFTFDERAFESMPGKPSTKDLVCPWSIDARDPTRLDVESESSRFRHRTLWISGLPPELSDQLVNDLTSIRARVNVSIHLAPYDRGESMTIVRRKNAEIKMQVMETRRKNRKQGLDPDDLPDDLADQQTQISELRDELSKTNQRLVNSMIVIGVSADTAEQLDLACKTVKAKVNAQSCKAESLKFMQIEGLTAELPLGSNPLPMKRTLTTNSAAILIPFTTQEVFEPHGLFYGSNARSGNPIVADRRDHMNSNGFILGTSGGGKSFTVKQELAGLYLNRDDEVIIIDPEREYLPLAQAFGGQIVQISAGSTTRINPLDIVLEETGDGDPVKEKTNNVVSMVGSLVGGNEGLNPVEKSLVDRCALNLYVRYREQGANPTAQPTLGDLRDMLEETGEAAGHELAVSLGSYTSGSLSGFNGQTNVDLNNRFTVFDVSGLTGELRTFGMMVVIDQVWNRVIRNRAKGRRTWLYIDEFHRFFGNQYSAGQFKDIYKRARKYGLGVTGITQNIEELLLDDDARLMLSNSDFLMLLSQNGSDADELCSLLKLSEEQRQFFTGVLPGQGLMKIGDAYVPFDGRIPSGGMLYRLYSTSFQQQ
jgi:conjugal transfer ATP-binding protein TraC